MAGRRRGRVSPFNRYSPRLSRSWSQPPDRNTAEFLDYLNRSPRLAVVDVISTDLAAAKGKLFQTDEEGNEQEIESHVFLEFMEQLNPMYELSSAAVWRLFNIFLEIKGEAYCLIERDLYGTPIELWPVPPHWVESVPHKDYPFYRVISPQAGVSMEVPMLDVFVQKTLNPYDPYGRGKGSAEAIADEIEIDEYAAKFQKRFFFNDATPALVFKMGDATDPSSFPSEDKKETFVERWAQKLRGWKKRDGFIAVDADIDVVKLSETMKDMDMVEGRKFIRAAVLEHFGVPREIMGITENSNRATSENAQYIYTSRVLKKRLEARQEAINTQLMPYFGENVFWRYDEIVPNDATHNLTLSNEGLSRGALTMNEWREMNGFPAVDNGDIFTIPSGFVAVGKDADIVQSLNNAALAASWGMPLQADDTGADDSQFEKTRKKGARRKERGPARLVSGTRATAELQGDIKKAESAIASIFGEYAQRAQDSLTSDFLSQAMENLRPKLDDLLRSAANGNDYLSAARPIVLREIEGLFNASEMGHDLSMSLESIWADVFGSSTDGEVDTINLIGAHGPQRMDILAENLKKEIADKISRGAVDPNVAPEDIATDAISVFSDADHIKRLAEDEIFIVESYATDERAKAKGYKKKSWVSRGDGDVRPSHKITNGQIVGINERFRNGCRFPRDPDAPIGEVAQCRCRCVYLYD